MGFECVVSGLGIHIGSINSCEDLVEHIIAKKNFYNKKAIVDSTNKAINDAVKDLNGQDIIAITNDKLSTDICKQYNINNQIVAINYVSMIKEMMHILQTKIDSNIVLVARGEDGCVAILVNKTKERYMTSLSIDNDITIIDEYVDNKSGSLNIDDSKNLINNMMKLVQGIVEVRYCLKLDKKWYSQLYLWDTLEKRELDLVLDGIKTTIKESELPNKSMFESGKYIIPVTFSDTQDARITLKKVQDELTKVGLFTTMVNAIKNLQINRKDNIIVFVVEDIDSINDQINELYSISDRLLDKGFIWKSTTGSLYVRKNVDKPQIVFMNPPGGMFKSNIYHKLFSKLYSFVDENTKDIVRETYINSDNEMVDRYLSECVITSVIMYMLDVIGIKPDYLSGASMGEIVFSLLDMKVPNGERDEYTQYIEGSISSIVGNKYNQSMEYFGRDVNLMKYYIKYDANKVREAIKEYDDIFPIIQGSPTDIIIIGEKDSCESLFKKLGCIPMTLSDAMYIHTPVIENMYKKIYDMLVEVGAYVDADKLPYKLFSTYMCKEMDSSSEMFANNFASILIKEVNYMEALEKLYENGARVFIDLSTTQLCTGWAKECFKDKDDVEIVAIYENKNTADYVVDMSTRLLASNVSFDYRKIFSRLMFINDKTGKFEHIELVSDKMDKTNKYEQVEIVSDKVEMADNYTDKEEEIKVESKNQVSKIDDNIVLRNYIKNQMNVNRQAYNVYLERERELYEQVLSTFRNETVNKDNVINTKTVEVNKPKKKCLWDREQIIEMTENSMAAVLGDKYKEVDKYPIRARMPLPPFLFVSRILDIDAEFGELRPSSIEIEFDIEEDCIYRVGDERISNLIASEASHIGIFLMGYIGLDVISNGTLSYRALDSIQIYHSDRLFRVGDTMKMIYKIDKFAQNGSTTIIYFSYEVYNGDELITTSKASGGFFTRAELESNKGIATPKLKLNPVEPKEFLHFTDKGKDSYTEEDIAQFYKGNYEACFGKDIRIALNEKYYLSHDVDMIKRITNIDYNGGKYGRGLICAECDITPDMWPFEVHFKNDPVLPGIVMIDGITQLEMFLFAHAGLLGHYDKCNVSMINDSPISCKFRGQVRKGHSLLRYEIHIKDVIEKEDGIYIYTETGIFNDDVQVIQIGNYGMKITP
ncbi:MAG: hypothetical protein E7262_11095 [Lachnospiraceae bacterium]|nr:hypothetical protein [Lachnospiraceae bacterium]